MESSLLTPQEFTRLATNFYVGRGLDNQISRIGLDADLINYVLTNTELVKKKYKVAFCCICVNPMYWQYIQPMIAGAKQFFLPGHETDFFLWSDIPEKNEELFKKAAQETANMTLAVNNQALHPQLVSEIEASYKNLYEQRDNLGATIFPIEPIEWPMPTLMRYHTMLQQEEILKEYDYIFYCDIDMAFVSVVGDEVLGERLTAVQQPMYALRKEFWPPYEPNTKSASYISRPGRVINGRFVPIYLAGGYQGGKSKDFIKAMKVMKKKIDKDFGINYVPIWNDETVWNSYLFENPDDRDIFLTPSYTYPDGLIKEYFEPMWGCSYQPKLMTLTKKFSFQPGAGEHLQQTLAQLSSLQPK